MLADQRLGPARVPCSHAQPRPRHCHRRACSDCRPPMGMPPRFYVGSVAKTTTTRAPVAIARTDARDAHDASCCTPAQTSSRSRRTCTESALCPSSFGARRSHATTPGHADTARKANVVLHDTRSLACVFDMSGLQSPAKFWFRNSYYTQHQQGIVKNTLVRMSRITKLLNVPHPVE